jgi:hypothetical protein
MTYAPRPSQRKYNYTEADRLFAKGYVLSTISAKTKIPYKSLYSHFWFGLWKHAQNEKELPQMINNFQKTDYRTELEKYKALFDITDWMSAEGQEILALIESNGELVRQHSIDETIYAPGMGV